MKRSTMVRPCFGEGGQWRGEGFSRHPAHLTGEPPNENWLLRCDGAVKDLFFVRPLKAPYGLGWSASRTFR
jgi:hypothetical protein